MSINYTMVKYLTCQISEANNTDLLITMIHLIFENLVMNYTTNLQNKKKDCSNKRTVFLYF